MLQYEKIDVSKEININKSNKSKECMLCHYWYFNPFQDGGGQKPPPTSFSPVPSTNVGISHQNFLIFRFNPFFTLV